MDFCLVLPIKMLLVKKCVYFGKLLTQVFYPEILNWSLLKRHYYGNLETRNFNGERETFLRALDREINLGARERECFMGD